MLRLSREADYAIVLMTRLAGTDPAVPQAASEVAMGVGLTPQMVSKILKRLARGELLVSHRGVNGGYRLARTPAEITVAEIITAIEGPIGLTVCVDHVPGACERESRCDVRANWQLINRRVLESLATITLAEMATPLGGGPGTGLGPIPLLRRSGSAAHAEQEKTPNLRPESGTNGA
jgi:FeS assembly SUF system regulator